MPNRDQTGPRGLGQSTGRGLGGCNQSAARGFGYGSGFGSGFGRGRARGFGMGFGRRVYYQNVDTPTSLAEEKKILEERLDYIKKELDK